MKFVKDLPAETRGMPAGIYQKYTWSAWLDGNAREAERGVDYICSDATFRGGLHAAARRRGGTVRTLITATGIQFQFMPGDAK